MTEAKKKDLLGMICIVIGSVFILAGVVLFILSNYLNLQMKKAEATVVAMYDIAQENGVHHTMVQLSYRVGDELMFANYEYPGVLAPETDAMEIYYNVKEPGMVLEGGWSFEAVPALILGAVILVSGLFLKGILDSKRFNLTQPKQSNSKISGQIYEERQKVLENALPMFASVLFIVFGIAMAITRGGWWPWMFIVVGGIELLYVGWEFIPAAIHLLKLAQLDKYQGKGKAYDVETDGEHLEAEPLETAKNPSAKNDNPTIAKNSNNNHKKSNNKRHK